jgi:hypothetical protein
MDAKFQFFCVVGQIERILDILDFGLAFLDFLKGLEEEGDRSKVGFVLEVDFGVAHVGCALVGLVVDGDPPEDGLGGVDLNEGRFFLSNLDCVALIVHAHVVEGPCFGVVELFE